MKMDNELPNRKPTRLKNFDYSNNGVYFITLCTQSRKSILSKIIVGEGLPLPHLSHYGKITEKWIQALSNQYQEMSVLQYVIMPNHIHLLLSVRKDDGRGDPSPTVDAAMGWLKYQATKEINKARNTAGVKVFQRSFYDHIVRNDEDYCEIYNYIYENPMRWKEDKLYTNEQK